MWLSGHSIAGKCFASVENYLLMKAQPAARTGNAFQALLLIREMLLGHGERDSEWSSWGSDSAFGIESIVNAARRPHLSVIAGGA